jgi:hypothetical protein
MPFVIEQSSLPTLVDNNEWFLDCLLSIYPDPSSLTSRRLRAKLYVDEVEIPFKSATWSESPGQANLSIELARLSDRTAFTRTALIKFESEEYLTGSWTLKKTYCDGAILATSDYNIENNGNTPNDSFSVTVKSVLQQKLDLTPTQIVVLYDPAKVTVEDSQLELVTNIDGTTTGSATVTPYADFTLQDALEYLADLYGCDGVKTNLNAEQWPLTRLDFPPAQPYWNTIAGEIGNHNPHIFIDDENYLVIKDGTLTDYLSARAMTVANFSGIRLSNTIERYKGIILSHQMKADAWDYYELRQENEDQWFGGIAGQYPLTRIVTWYQDFYKIGISTPVNSQEFSVRQLEYSDAGTLISATAERFSYQFGQGGIRMKRHEMKEWGIANVPDTWVTFQSTIPGPNTEFAGAFSGAEEAYTATNVTSHSESFVLTKAERTDFSYFPVYGQADASYQGQTDAETRGLIVTDTENQQLGENFEQPWNKAQENGNLAEGQNARWGTTDYRKEKQKAERKKRQVQLRTRRHSALNSTNGLIAESYHDRRIGDVAESDIQTETKPVYITENGDPTASLWRQVNGGDAPLEILQPLCHRLNKQQDYPGGIQADLPTYDETMAIGVVINPSNRAGTSLGIHEVISYTDVFRSVEEGGFQTSIQTRQIG